MGIFLACEHGVTGDCRTCGIIAAERRTTDAVKEQTREATRAAEEQTRALREQAEATRQLVRATAVRARAAEDARQVTARAVRDDELRQRAEREQSQRDADWEAYKAERDANSEADIAIGRALLAKMEADEEALIDDRIADAVAATEATALENGQGFTDEERAQLRIRLEPEIRAARDAEHAALRAARVAEREETARRVQGWIDGMDKGATFSREARQSLGMTPQPDYSFWRWMASPAAFGAGLYGIWRTDPRIGPLLVAVGLSVVFMLTVGARRRAMERYRGEFAFFCATVVILTFVTQFGAVLESGADRLLACVVAVGVTAAAHLIPYSDSGKGT